MHCLPFRAKPALPLLLMLAFALPLSAAPRPPKPVPNAPAAGAEEAAALDRQATELEEKAEFKTALPLARRALALREKTLGPRHPDTAASLYTLAGLLEDTGDLAGAETHYRRALGIREAALGPEHPDVAQTLNALGSTLLQRGDLARGEDTFRRALAIRERTDGADAINTAKPLNNLAAIRQLRGDPAEAAALYARALAIFEKRLPPGHPMLANTLNNLSLLHREVLGDAARAVEYGRRALAIREATLSPEHPAVASSLDNLGSALGAMGDHRASIELDRRALAILEKTAGPDHPDTNKVRNNLAVNLVDVGELAEAETLETQTLAARERTLGERHPDTASSLMNLAHLRRLRADPAGAETLARRAVEADLAALGPDHPDTALALDAQAGALLALGRKAEAAAAATRAAHAREAALASVLSFTSEAQRLEFQAHAADSYSLLATLGEAAPLAETVLRTKGAVLDSLLEDRLLARASADPARRAQIEEARAARRQLTEEQMQPPAADAPEAERKKHAATVAELAAKMERLEGAMARQVTGLGGARRALGVTVAQVRAALPADGALVEFLRYEHALGDGGGDKREARYGAVVIPPAAGAGRGPAWVPLGPAAGLEETLRAYGEGVRGRGGDPLALEETLHTLYRQVWSPVQGALPPGTRQVLLSPDGELNALSFATLLTAEDRFLGEGLGLAYVASGRDLLKLTTAAPSPEPGKRLVVFSNPKLDAPPAAEPPSAAAVNAIALRGGERGSFRDLRLPPLPGAEAEGAALAAQARAAGWKCETFADADATERRLFSAVRSPRVLHLATHGFFLARPAEGSRDAAFLNPMRRSGLALASAGATLAAWARGEVPSSDNDGVVTAEEVAGLDLRGTWLVTLSACESGAGEARAGEGVLGLRRGFALAGAHNLLLTLWPVADAETAALMLGFYAAAEKTGDPARALAETQRDALTRLRRERGTAAAVRLAGAFILSSQGR